MPITSSAKKALRSSMKKRVFNVRTKAGIDIPMKKFRKLIEDKDKKQAQAMVSVLYKALDKGAKRKYIKANTAARYKSRIMARLNKLV